MILFEEKIIKGHKSKQIIFIILIKLTNKQKTEKKSVACEYLNRAKEAVVDYQKTSVIDDHGNEN